MLSFGPRARQLLNLEQKDHSDYEGEEKSTDEGEAASVTYQIIATNARACGG